MADAITTFSVLSKDAVDVWISREMYALAERNLLVGKYAKAHTLPQRMGKTMRIIRVARLNIPRTTLTEGVAPDAVALATENVDVSVEQWGIVVRLTDVAEITTSHPALPLAIDRTALVISELQERELCQTLLAGTTVFYPGTATTRATIGAGDKLDTATAIKTTVSLRNKGAPVGEGLFNGIMSPQQEGDVVTSDATFKDASNFANVRKLEFGEIGIWMGVRWARSNFLPIYRGVAAPTTAAATAEKTQFSGTGSDVDTARITVVARDVSTNFERKISQEATLADEDDITFPSSANYTYDLYMTDSNGSGANYKLLAANQAASSVFQVTAAKYTAANAATPPSAPASAREVFVAFITGKDAYGRVALNGMSLQSYVTPAGASWENPLAQGRKVGTKIMVKHFIIDNNFFARVESASAFGAELPA